jgi:hypothetical protein
MFILTFLRVMREVAAEAREMRRVMHERYPYAFIDE